MGALDFSVYDPTTAADPLQMFDLVKLGELPGHPIGKLGIVVPVTNGPDTGSIFGDVRVYYGSGQDEYDLVSQESSGLPKWRFQFSTSVKDQLVAKFRSSFDKPILERIFAAHIESGILD